MQNFAGLQERNDICSTCNMTSLKCPGYMGSIRLPLPVFNPFLFKHLIKVWWFSVTSVRWEKIFPVPVKLQVFLCKWWELMMSKYLVSLQHWHIEWILWIKNYRQKSDRLLLLIWSSNSTWIIELTFICMIRQICTINCFYVSWNFKIWFLVPLYLLLLISQIMFYLEEVYCLCSDSLGDISYDMDRVIF